MSNDDWQKVVIPTGNEIDSGSQWLWQGFEGVDYEGTISMKECTVPLKRYTEVFLKYAQGQELRKIKDNFLEECRIYLEYSPTSIYWPIFRLEQNPVNYCIRSLSSCNEPIQITCCGNGEGAA